MLLFLSLKYYYSIKDISVGGMCICYGHAKACPLNADTKVKKKKLFLSDELTTQLR